ncbi:MAG: hypothetical protein AUK03_03970 [Anaerolineae bacterium CG2_30_64_16]|nr:MAG: hypothetical protein AUK03_03970 [Anaerolineae bacterium CG2_30_64_16]
MLQTALKFDLKVPPEGRIELRVPFPSGSHVTVFVVEEPAERFDDLLAAAESSLDFWDNPLDDEDWNHA